jgi:hypothetical protein
LLTIVHKRQGSIITQLGDQMQTTLHDHLHCIVIAKVQQS